jgi:hypothetical protein
VQAQSGGGVQAVGAARGAGSPGRQLATDRGALDKELTVEDRARLLVFLKGGGAIGGKSDGWAFTGSPRRGYRSSPAAAGDIGQLLGEAPALSEFFARGGTGRCVSFEFDYDQAMMMFQPVGGMDRIAHVRADRVGNGRLRYGAQVVRSPVVTAGSRSGSATPGARARRAGRLPRIRAPTAHPGPYDDQPRPGDPQGAVGARAPPICKVAGAAQHRLRFGGAVGVGARADLTDPSRS